MRIAATYYDSRIQEVRHLHLWKYITILRRSEGVKQGQGLLSSFLSHYGKSTVSFLVNGLHLSILIIIFKNAVNKLYFRKARTAYSEQVGLNLQAGLITGDTLF